MILRSYLDNRSTSALDEFMNNAHPAQWFGCSDAITLSDTSSLLPKAATSQRNLISVSCTTVPAPTFSITGESGGRVAAFKRLNRVRRHPALRPTKASATIIFYSPGATCWQPQTKGITVGSNSIYNNWRMEDVWLDK